MVAAELESALARDEPDLASQVHGLRIGRVCRRSDPTWMTFDIPGRRRRGYSHSIVLEELSGLVVVDVGSAVGLEPRWLGRDVGSWV